jgi:hypothetical protein
MSARTASPVATVDTLADFRVSVARPATYKIADNARRVPVPAISDAAYVARGVHAKTGAPALIITDGSAQRAIELCAVGAAIAGGAITRAELDALAPPS